MLEDWILDDKGLKKGRGGRDDKADNELSIETKAKLYNLVQ